MSEDTEIEDILVITHPLAAASEAHVAALLNILTAITSVTLVTANLGADSSIRDDNDIIELSQQGVGDSIVIAAFRFVANQFRMCRTIRTREETIILFFGSTSYLLPIAFARLTGKTVVLEPRGNVPLTLRLHWEQRIPVPFARGLAGLVWLLERMGYRLSDAIITYTPSMADELGLGLFEEKLYPNGARYIDTDQFHPRVPFEERENVVGFLGRLDEEKNVQMLADVARKLPKDMTFRFIGDGELREELERELAEERATGQVEFTGWVDHDNVPEELSKLRLLVLPSEPTEGLPTVILESMACGTPVLATPVSGVPDVVRDGETGYLLTQSASTRVADRIIETVRADDLVRISENGQRLITQEYSFEGAVDRYRKILRDFER